jgi:hypothetical protein
LDVGPKLVQEWIAVVLPRKDGLTFEPFKVSLH